jgi:hypothetical protein
MAYAHGFMLSAMAAWNAASSASRIACELPRRPLRTALLNPACRAVKKPSRPFRGEPNEFRRDSMDDGLTAGRIGAPLGGFWHADAPDEVSFIFIEYPAW